MYDSRYSRQILVKLEFSGQIFEKYTRIKFHGSPSCRSRVVACGRTDGRTNRLTDMTKLIVVFRNFANAPKKWETYFKKRMLYKYRFEVCRMLSSGMWQTIVRQTFTDVSEEIPA